MNEIGNNIKTINKTLTGTAAKLVAVSKTKPNTSILEAYEVGQRIFGENKVQELSDKYEQLPKDIEWHMIGHLQRNKVKYIASFIHLIHSVDSLKLLKEINKQGEKNDRVVNCLLQCHIAQEDTKFGLDEEELNQLLNGEELKSMKFVKIIGLMGMATNTDDESQIHKEFEHIHQLFEKAKANFQSYNVDISELSIGMSGDFKIAVQHGSTLVRVGSSIFGARNYA
jgi:pyridoxal phosphate enzyme (YggS family)